MRKCGKAGILLVAVMILLSGWKDRGFDEKEFIVYLKEMHRNIYKAFDYDDDNEIYNCLSFSFAGDELECQFFEFLETIREYAAQGYKNFIRSIEYEDVIIEKKTKKYIKVYMKWRVYGLVKHLLHEHNRRNTYEAIYRLEKEEKDDWKIVGTQILSGERIIFQKKYYDPASDPGIEQQIIIEKVNQPL